MYKVFQNATDILKKTIKISRGWKITMKHRGGIKIFSQKKMMLYPN